MTIDVPPSLVASRRYHAYGLTIDSEVVLGGLPGASSVVDQSQLLNIVRRPIHHPVLAEARDMTFVDDGAAQILAWPTVGAFRVASADVIEVDPKADVHDDLVALPLLGSVLATLLHRRGQYVLHASAVAVGDQAVALMGDKGAGKSTTAAALVAAGHSLLTDDIVAIDFAGDRAPAVLPAYGQIKLWDDSVVGLGEMGLTDKGRLHALVEKSNYQIAPNGFRAAASPIARLYVLKRSETPQVTQLPPPEALAALLRYSYLARFGEAGFGNGIGEHFRRSAELANAGVVRVLSVPAGLDQVHRISALIEDDLAKTPA